MLDLIIKNGKCYINGELKNVDVAIKDGKIQNTYTSLTKPTSKKITNEIENILDKE